MLSRNRQILLATMVVCLTATGLRAENLHPKWWRRVVPAVSQVDGVEVGRFLFWNDEHQVFVQFQATDDYELKKLNVHAALSEAGLPQNPTKKLLPAQFAIKMIFNPRVAIADVIPFTQSSGLPEGTPVFIAIECVVVNTQSLIEIKASLLTGPDYGYSLNPQDKVKLIEYQTSAIQHSAGNVRINYTYTGDNSGAAGYWHGLVASVNNGAGDPASDLQPGHQLVSFCTERDRFMPRTGGFSNEPALPLDADFSDDVARRLNAVPAVVKSGVIAGLTAKDIQAVVWIIVGESELSDFAASRSSSVSSRGASEIAQLSTLTDESAEDDKKAQDSYDLVKLSTQKAPQNQVFHRPIP